MFYKQGGLGLEGVLMLKSGVDWAYRGINVKNRGGLGLIGVIMLKTGVGLDL